MAKLASSQLPRQTGQQSSSSLAMLSTGCGRLGMSSRSLLPALQQPVLR